MHRADLSNTQFALEAIRALEAVAEEDAAAAGTGEGTQTRVELAYDRAIRYLSRCQNLQATNDQPWASNDGGFVYRPGESKAGEVESQDEGEETNGLRSYAGMTYAGLKSMIYARLQPDDPRVVAAWGWVSRNWSVTENPGLGQQGLYYYYLTMARALHTLGTDEVAEPDGKAHDWRVELTQQLLRVQRADGSWFNENGRWMEQIPDLVTAYAVLAIEHATRNW
jgi:squalene-hopene/tetraprenyl-beta-curcumene cyclase